MHFVFFSLCFLAATLSTAAQTAKPPAAPPKLTLAQALAAAPPPDSGLRLTVGADKVTLPDGVDAPPTGASLGDITAAFNDITVRFSDVVAIAPAAITLLNTQPDAPDVGAGIDPSMAFKMLAASLDDAQWKSLTSERGIGLPDLSDDTQWGLFHALFRHGHLFFGSEDPVLDKVPSEQRTDVRDVTDQIDGTRVRLGQMAHIYLHDKSGRTIFWDAPRPGQAGRLHTWNPKTAPPAAVQGVALRAEAPNALKQSDLDWDSEALAVAVPISGVKTVGDLVTRIGLATKQELYADPHYASKTLAITGPASAAPAADLLRAVCVCVTGTFRKVGPAYVLTDDIVGVGVRRKHLKDWKDAADRQIDHLRDRAGSTLLAHRAAEARALTGLGDPLALTPEEIAAVPPDPDLPSLPMMFDSDHPYAKLTPAQQEWARQTAAAYDESRQNGTLPDYLTANGPREADLTRTVTLGMDAQVQLLVPSVDTPVDTNLSGGALCLLFYPGEDELQARDAIVENQTKAKIPAPPLSSVLHLGRCRAVLVHPRTAADVDALVIAMQKLGLNQLWLDVFSGGVDHVTASGTHSPDILTEAVNKTRGTGIGVYADMSLLEWGGDAPDSALALTIDGQNSRQFILAVLAIAKENPYRVLPPLPAVLPLEVSPAAGPVQDTLAGVVQKLAAQPGLAGFVWEDANADADFGYTPLLRLAFLRSAHADSIDITEHSGDGAGIGAAAALPLFDDDASDTSLETQWVKSQEEARRSLIGRLFALSQTSSALPVLTGDDLMVRLTPALLAQTAASAETLPRPPVAARRVRVQSDGDTPALARTLADNQKAAPAAGFVLDFQREEVTQGTAPLDALVRAVAAEQPAKER